ncbi:MAG: hypothetical protein H0X51_00945 [Parachlamydiaceae bacterium]|nr:hypothetical protein [Parachlamydiaceae bacterium]
MVDMNPREAAYLALLSSSREEVFIANFLEQWRLSTQPSSLDLHFAQQLANGTSQMSLSLDYLAVQLNDGKKISIKQKERLLLRLSLFQFYFLDRVPIYAIADEMMDIANRYCHRSFTSFLNFLLRKLPQANLNLPAGDDAESLSIRFSYPLYFVKNLRSHYSVETTKQILESGNKPAPVMARIRSERLCQEQTGFPIICSTPLPVAVIKDPILFQTIAESSHYYIQNATPATLLGNLCLLDWPPSRILDLCASPGGKLLAVADAFPDAQLYANDLSLDKMIRLQKNCEKYGIHATLSCMRGEDFTSEKPFDLIILDVPCSNSGVLNKRSEARWRLSEENILKLKELQKQLFEHALSLLATNGEIWYMTCSILPEENEDFISEMCQSYSLKIRQRQTILPNAEGWDGGFACALTR